MSQKGAEGVDFVAEFGDFGGAFLFLVFEFLLEFFDLKAGGVVFFAELALDRVVLNKNTWVLVFCKLGGGLGAFALKVACCGVEEYLFFFGLSFFERFVSADG